MPKAHLKKIIITVLAAIPVLILGLFVALFLALPAPELVGRLLSGSKDSSPSSNNNQPTPSAEDRISQESKVSKMEKQTSADSESVPTLPPSEPNSNTGNDLVEARYIDQTETVTPEQICSSLSKGAVKVSSQQDFGAELQRIEGQQGEYSALVESVMLPVGQLLALPKVSGIIKEAREAKARGESGILSKAAFYSKAAAAVTEIYIHSEELNRTADVGYYLYVLSRTADKAPGLRSNPEVFSVCEEMVSAPPDSEEEQQELASRVGQFIRELGLSDADVGFNPDYRTQLEVKTDKNSLTVGMGWMNEIFQSKAGR